MRPSANDSALVLFPGALGDFICFLPTLLSLRERHRGPLLVVAKPVLLALVEIPDAASASIDRREIADLFAVGTPIAPDTRQLLGGFTHVYSWTGFGNVEFAERLTAVSGGSASVYHFRGMQPGEHAADYYARCAGVVPPGSVAASIVTDAEWLAAFEEEHCLVGHPLLVMHPGSGAVRKNWQGFDAVRHHWRRHHDDGVVAVHGPADPQGAAVGSEDVLSVEGLSLPQVAALLHRSRLYLGNDSGVSHLAAAVGAHGVALFGPTDPAVWGPRGRLKIVHAPNRCPTCPPDAFCMHRLPPQRVIDALERTTQ